MQSQMVCQGYIDCSHSLIKLRMLATLLSPLFVMVVIEKNFVMTFVLVVIVGGDGCHGDDCY